MVITKELEEGQAIVSTWFVARQAVIPSGYIVGLVEFKVVGGLKKESLGWGDPS